MATTTDPAATPPSWAIETEQLDVGYAGHAVVEQISLALRPGGLLCLIGTNGSGKSTLLKTLAGLIEHFHQLQPVFVEAMKRRVGEVLDMVEDAEPDAAHSLQPSATRQRRLSRRSRVAP